MIVIIRIALNKLISHVPIGVNLGFVGEYINISIRNEEDITSVSSIFSRESRFIFYHFPNAMLAI